MADVAVTKTDKLKPMRRKARVRELYEMIPLPKSSVVMTSAEKKTGIDELWKAVDTRVWSESFD